jgi:hypothetical protein
VLSQLSYSPARNQNPEDRRQKSAAAGWLPRLRDVDALRLLSSVICLPNLVGPGRFELPTSRLSSARSNQLSYEPNQTTDVRDKKRERANRRFLSSVFWLLSSDRVRRRDARTAVGNAMRCVRCSNVGGRETAGHSILRKEVIQPQVPLRLPCYDFTPVADPTVVGCLLAVSVPASGKTNSHGVTGGVYKARERIHRGVLIRDY